MNSLRLTVTLEILMLLAPCSFQTHHKDIQDKQGIEQARKNWRLPLLLLPLQTRGQDQDCLAG